MVQAHRGDHADLRGHHVGGIQTPAQSDLDHADVDAILRETLETHGRQVLEQGRRPGIGIGGVGNMVRPHGVGQLRESVPGDRLPIPPDALAEGVQVRRRIETGGISGRPGDGLHHGGRAALALGSRHVHHSPAPVRVAHARQQSLHVAQVVDSLLPRLRGRRTLVVDQAQQPGDRILVTCRHDAR